MNENKKTLYDVQTMDFLGETIKGTELYKKNNLFILYTSEGDFIELTLDEAKKEALKILDSEEYENVFGEEVYLDSGEKIFDYNN